MLDPLKFACNSKPLSARVATAAAAFALSFGLFSASAQAGPAMDGDGLKSPGVALQAVGYKKKYKRLYQPNYYPSNPDYAKEPYMPFGGSDEILELQRRFPQTNWPQSMRYFPNTP